MHKETMLATVVTGSEECAARRQEQRRVSGTVARMLLVQGLLDMCIVTVPQAAMLVTRKDTHVRSLSSRIEKK